jgi:hypothetical protein
MVRHRKILEEYAEKHGMTVSQVKSQFMRNVMLALKKYLGKERWSSPMEWVKHGVAGHLSVFLNTAYDLLAKTGKIPTPDEILEAVRAKITATA